MSMQFSARVVISDSALPTIISAAMEAYIVDHGGLIKWFPKDRIETYGLLWGYVRNVDPTYGCPVIFVDSATVDTSARMKRDSVSPKHEALSLKIRLFNLYWPQLSLIGEFHSHPYDDPAEAREAQGWNFSEGDDESTESFVWNNGMELAIQLVVAVSEMERSGWMKPRYVHGYSAINFVINNYKLWLKAGVAIRQDDADGNEVVWIDNDHVILDCPRLLLSAKPHQRR